MVLQMTARAVASRFKVAGWVVLACMRCVRATPCAPVMSARLTYTLLARMQSSARERRGSGHESAVAPVEVGYTSYPVSVTDTMYKDQRVRKAIDECAFRYTVALKIYHWWSAFNNNTTAGSMGTGLRRATRRIERLCSRTIWCGMPHEDDHQGVHLPLICVAG